jgi:hypothetical protein
MSRNRRNLRAIKAGRRDPLTDPITLADEPTEGFTYLGFVWTPELHGIGLALAQEFAEGSPG